MVTNDARGDWVRARREGEKEERREAMLAAAAALLEEQDFAAINMAAIASRAGVAKGLLYRYFETKEALFLALYVVELAEWIDAVDAAFPGVRPRKDPDRLARDLVATIEARPELCKLTALLSSVLERNLSLEVAVEFKRAAAAAIARLQAIFVRAVPALDEALVLELLQQLQALVAGLWPMAHPSDVLAEAMALPELAHLEVDFEARLESALAHLLRGLMRKKKGR